MDLQPYLGLLTAIVIPGFPFAALLAKPLRRHPNPRLRSLGGLIATLALWASFNFSFLTLWATIIREPILEDTIAVFLAVLALAQIPAAWISARLGFGESGAGAARVRSVANARAVVSS
jgi:hypothetical protein